MKSKQRKERKKERETKTKIKGADAYPEYQPTDYISDIVALTSQTPTYKSSYNSAVIIS